MPEVKYDGDPITLRWSHHVPPVSGMAKNVYIPGFRLLEKLSNGKIKVDEKWGGTVHAANAGYDATRSETDLRRYLENLPALNTNPKSYQPASSKC